MSENRCRNLNIKNISFVQVSDLNAIFFASPDARVRISLNMTTSGSQEAATTEDQWSELFYDLSVGSQSLPTSLVFFTKKLMMIFSFAFASAFALISST